MSEIVLGNRGYLYLTELPPPVIGDGTIAIPATDKSDKRKDLLVVVKSVGDTSGLPVSLQAKDIFLHYGPEKVLNVGDEVYIFNKDIEFPATGVEISTEGAKIPITSQEDFGHVKEVNSGSQTTTISITARRAVKNPIQERVLHSFFRTAKTHADGGMIMEAQREFLALLFLNHLENFSDDTDDGVAMVVTFTDAPNNWAMDGVSEFNLSGALHPMASPTRIISTRN